MLVAPIFIVGANRSGTTLLRLILNAHPRIAIPEELVYFDSSLAGVSLEHWRTPKLSPLKYEQFVTRFLERNCAPLGLDTEMLRQEILEGPPSLRYPYRVALEAWAQRHGKARWGEKTPGNLFFAGLILEMFPEAQFIYLARDPRAGVHSMNKTDFLSRDTVINALNRRHYATNGLALLERVVPEAQRMVLRYEDLVEAPETTSRDVCAFLGEDYDSSMLHFHRDAEQYMKQRAASGFNEAATRPIDASKVDTWKTHLSEKDVSIVELLCRAEMERFGYERRGIPVSGQTLLEIGAKWVYYRLRRWRSRDVPQFILKERVLERTRQRMRQLVGRLSQQSSV